MSKSLKYLNHIKNDDFNMMIATYPPIPAYNGISKPEMFNIIRKELTALDIIINKKVDVGRLFYSNDLDDYNEYIIRSGGGYYTLTPNEYKTIMEVLGE